MRKPRNAPSARILLSDFDNHRHICDIFGTPWCDSLDVANSELLDDRVEEITCPNCIIEIHKLRERGLI